jgi:hypothetical protein
MSAPACRSLRYKNAGVRAFSIGAAALVLIPGAGWCRQPDAQGASAGQSRAGATSPEGAAKSRTAIANVAYADCLARHESRRVQHVVDAGFGQGFDAAFSQLPIKNCVPGPDVTNNAAGLRGPIFKVMYVRFGPAAGRSAAHNAVNWTTSLPVGSPMLAWYLIGSCVEAHAPGDSRALVLAATESASERERFSKIMPKLSNCLPAGQRFAIDRTVLTGVLAEIVYRIYVGLTVGDARMLGS